MINNKLAELEEMLDSKKKSPEKKPLDAVKEEPDILTVARVMSDDEKMDKVENFLRMVVVRNRYKKLVVKNLSAVLLQKCLKGRVFRR